MTDILCVNETEAMIFAGYENALDSFNTDKEIENVLEVLLKKSETVIITLGKNGAAYATKELGAGSYKKVDAPTLDKCKL